MAEVVYVTNDPGLSAKDLTGLYTAVGWNTDGVRTEEKTRETLRDTKYYVSAHIGDELVGFGRILGDGYAGEILDVMTHPDYRGRGIATGIMNRLMEFASGKFIGIHLIAASGSADFYKHFGFGPANPKTDMLMYFSPSTPR